MAILKKPIKHLGIFIILSGQAAYAGQGLLLNIRSYLPNTSIKIESSQCVTGVENLSINNTTYLNANNDGICLLQKSGVKFSLLYNEKIIANYTVLLSIVGSTVSPQGITKEKDILSIANFYPHSGVSGTVDWINISIGPEEDNWMGQLESILANKSINSVILPGSHDTGTYAITETSVITSDLDDKLKFWIRFDPLKMKHLRDWSITQNIDTRTQLNVGIRYFDLRICKSEDNKFLTCHAMAGDALENIFHQLIFFLNDPRHQKEMIILDFNHLYDITHEDIDRLAELIKSSFGNKIASSRDYSPKSLVSSFWKQQAQVIIFIDDNYAWQKYPTLFWPDLIASPYPSKQGSNGLESFMRDALVNRDWNKFFVLQTQETPTRDMIINGYDPFSTNPSSLLKMTANYKLDISYWFDQREVESLIKQNGNIIIEDFSNGMDLTELAKRIMK